MAQLVDIGLYNSVRWKQSDGNRFKYLAGTAAIESAFGVG